MSEQNFIGNNDHLPQNAVDEPLPEQEVREFLCQYCDKKFCSTRALGGHQKAHRRERLVEKMEKQRRRWENMNSTQGITSRNQPYPYPFSSHIHYQGYFRGANLHHPISACMSNTMPSWPIGCPSSAYGGLHMPNTPSTTPQSMMEMSSSSLTAPQFGMADFRDGGQNVALLVPQRSNTLGFGLLSQANQTPSIVQGVERNFIAQFDSQTHPLMSHTSQIGEGPIQENPDVSSSSAQSTSGELNLNLTL
jgi:hypothetical protein